MPLAADRSSVSTGIRHFAPLVARIRRRPRTATYRPREEPMPVETPSLFDHVIQDHLELKRRNSELEPAMPLDRYKSDDPFHNHPLFKTEEQARIEETMDGEESIPLDHTSLAAEPEPAAEDDTLWGRSRDFDWGD
jgi:hypothetical protein